MGNVKRQPSKLARRVRFPLPAPSSLWQQLRTETRFKNLISRAQLPRCSKVQRPPLGELPISHALESQLQVQTVESILFQINWAHAHERIQEAFRG